MSFLTLSLAQIWHVFAVRNPGLGWLRNEVTGNPWILDRTRPVPRGAAAARRVLAAARTHPLRVRPGALRLGARLRRQPAATGGRATGPAPRPAARGGRIAAGR